MSLRMPPKVAVLREAGRTCSACRGPASSSVLVRQLDATAHLLFCRHCAQRIGTVSRALTTTKPRTTRKGD